MFPEERLQLAKGSIPFPDERSPFPARRFPLPHERLRFTKGNRPVPEERPRFTQRPRSQKGALSLARGAASENQHSRGPISSYCRPARGRGCASRRRDGPEERIGDQDSRRQPRELLLNLLTPHRIVYRALALRLRRAQRVVRDPRNHVDLVLSAGERVPAALDPRCPTGLGVRSCDPRNRVPHLSPISGAAPGPGASCFRCGARGSPSPR